MKRIFTLFFALILTNAIMGQTSPNDCVNAIVVCGNGTFSSNASGSGNTQEVAACGGSEHNSIWIKINIAQSGTLGFDLIPNDPNLSVDYDFWVYGPNKACGSLGSSIRCATTNPLAAGLTNNHTGMFSGTVDNYAGPGANAGDAGIGYVQSLTVVAGEYYYIAVDRPIGDGGFQIQWTGTATLGTGAFPTPPAVNPIRDFIRCSASGTAVLALNDVTTWIFANNANLNAANYTITYYNTLADAVDGVSPIPGFVSTNAPKRIFVKIVNNVTKCNTISEFFFKVVGIPSANIAISDTQICASQNVTVTFTGTPNSVVEYRVNGGAIQMVTLDATGNYQLVTSVSANTTYTLVRAKNLDTNGTTICSQLETDSVSVSVLTIPTPNLTTNSPICEGTNAVLNFSGLADAVITYTVDNGANQTVTLDNTGQQQVTLTGLIGGSHLITLTNITDSNPPNCSLPLNSTETIVVNSQIVASVSGSTSVCKDAAQPQITFTGTNGTAPYTFVYTINGGANQTVTTTSGDSVTVAVPTNSIGTFTYDLVSASSATTPVCSYPQTGSASVTINDIPQINGTLSVCQGGTTQLSSPETPAASNAWTSSDSLIATVDTTGNVTGVSAGTANITFTNLNGCFNTVAVTVKPIPAGFATPVSDEICSGSAPNILLSSDLAGATFDWTVVQSGVTGAANGSGTSISQILMNSGSTVGTVTYTIIPKANGCDGIPFDVVITVNPIPTGSATPSSETICSGATTTISLSGPVSGTTFDWTVVSTGVSGASNGTGTTIAQTLTTTGSATGTATYTVTPTANGCLGTPFIVVVTVNPLPSVVATPSFQDICSGTAPNISLSSLVAGTTFNWTVASTDVSGASNGSGTSINQVLTATATTNGTATYTVTPTANGCQGTPFDVIITVKPVPTGSATPSSETICSGATTNIALSSAVSGTTFDWTVASTGVSGASNGTGATIAQTLTTTGSATGSVTYTVTPTANGCIGTPFTVAVTVNPIPTGSATPASATICSGSAPNILLSGPVTGTTFDWTVASTDVSGASNGSGSSIAQTLTSTGSVTGTVTYTVTPTANGCVGTPFTVVVTVDPIPTGSASPSSDTICSGTAPNISLSSPVAGTTFSWTVVSSGVSGASNASGATIAQTLSTTGSATGTATYTVTPTANGCTGATFDVVVTVNPIPTGSATPPSDAICSGTAPNITLSGPVAGTTFDWTVASVGVSGASNGFGATIAQTLTTTGTINGTVTYTVTPSANGCSGTPFTVVVTVKPTPTGSATPSSDAICSGTAPNITLSGPVAGTTFAWTVASVGVSGASNGSGATIAQTLTATGTTNGTVTYTITPSANGCTGAPFDVVVTVKPIPDVVATPASQTICSGLTTGIALTSGVTGTTFSWTVVATGVTGASNGTGASIAQTLTATGAANGTATYTITPMANGCTGTPIQVVITVLSSPSATISVSGTNPICSGSTSQITIVGNANTTVDYTVNGTSASIAIPASGTVSFTTAALSAQTTYQLVSISAGVGCTYPITAPPAVVNIAPQPTASISIPETICNGSSTNIIFTGTAGATVSYTVNGSATPQTVVIEPDGNTSVNTGALTTNTTYQLVNVTGGTAPNCVEPLTGSTLISVVPVPTVTSLPTSQSLCSGQSTGIQLQGLPNTTFSWTVATTGGVTGASNGTGAVISQVLTAGAVVGTVTYTITPKIGSCTGSPINVVVTVSPMPVLVVTNNSPSICTGSNTNITFSSNIPGTTYSWNAVQTGASGSSNGTGTSIQQALTALGNNPGEVAYTITPEFNGCPGASKTVIVKVNPIPVVTATPTAQTLCSGTRTNIALTSNVPNTTFSWLVVQSGVIGTSSGSGNTIAQLLTAIGTTQGTVDYIITPTANGCSGNPITVTVKVNPVPEVFNTTGTTTICSGESAEVLLSANIPATTFTWTVTQSGVTGATAGSGSSISQVLEATGTTAGQVTYVITPSANGCDGTPISVVFTVNPLPKPKLEEGYICVDPNTGTVTSTYTLDAQIDNSTNAYTFYWYHNGTLVETSASSTYLVQYDDSAVNHGVGTYMVIVKNNATGCETDPLTAPQVDVEVSLGAQSWSYIVSDYFEDDQAITVFVQGTGSYLYSLDGGPFQTSNIFPHVLPGEHYVTINDQNGCTDVTIEHIFTIGYPHFFTPNGDGYNDYWNITSLKGSPTNGDAEIQIFDRYGKLMMVTTPDGSGWDGTLNGQPLPATDYWFTVKYDENGVEKVFKAHFSLKR